MASSALEEKMKKIRLQNEKIRQRYEEVEADKKNAAKLNALVQLVPSDDWPERKEPPEFSAPPKNPQKPKPSKEHNDRQTSQHYPGVQERLSKKDHKFAQGDGPPPDPKYNFLADSEREMREAENGKNEDDKNRSRNKTPRGPPKRRGGGGGGGSGNGSGGLNQPFFKDNRGPHAFRSKGESLPEYEAWRAERERIDEARISRQKTAEGNWRREWDCNKVNVEREPENFRQGDSNRKDFDKRNNHFENDYSNRGHGASRMFHGSQKNHGNQDYRRPYHEHNQSHEYKKQLDNKQPFSPTDDKMFTTLDQGKGPVMSVKVNSPSIAGTGRVGPRQKSRITYFSQSDADADTHELGDSPRQKSFDEKSSGAPKSTPKSPFPQRRKEGNPKSPYPQKKEFRGDDQSARPKNPTRNMNAPKNEHRDQRQPNQHTPKPQRAPKRGAQKAASETAQSVPSSSDNAIPSEYNPKKSFNCESSSKQIVNDENDADQVPNESNQSNVESSEESKTQDVSAQIVETVDQNVCNIKVENSNAENDGNNEIDKNNENEKVNDKSANAIEFEDITQSIVEVLEKIKCEVAESTESEVTNQNIDEKETEVNLPDDITQEDKEKQKREEILQESEQNESKLAENKNDENINAEEETELVASNEELHSSISQEIKGCEVEQSPVHEVETIKVENQVLKDDEAQQTSSPETEKIENLIELNEKELFDPEPTPLNDSGIVDISSELDKTKTSEIDNSQFSSADDSGLTNDSNQTQNDIDVAEADSKTDIKDDSQIQSDPVDVTKENCEKSSEICDNTSASASEATEQAGVEEQVKTSDDNSADEPTEGPTKDNDVEVVKADDKDLESTDEKIAEEKESAVEESKTA